MHPPSLRMPTQQKSEQFRRRKISLMKKSNELAFFSAADVLLFIKRNNRVYLYQSRGDFVPSLEVLVRCAGHELCDSADEQQNRSGVESKTADEFPAPVMKPRGRHCRRLKNQTSLSNTTAIPPSLESTQRNQFQYRATDCCDSGDRDVSRTVSPHYLGVEADQPSRPFNAEDTMPRHDLIQSEQKAGHLFLKIRKTEQVLRQHRQKQGQWSADIARKKAEWEDKERFVTQIQEQLQKAQEELEGVQHRFRDAQAQAEEAQRGVAETESGLIASQGEIEQLETAHRESKVMLQSLVERHVAWSAHTID